MQQQPIHQPMQHQQQQQLTPDPNVLGVQNSLLSNTYYLFLSFLFFKNKIHVLTI
jgi:hypothetical protein